MTSFDSLIFIRVYGFLEAKHVFAAPYLKSCILRLLLTKANNNATQLQKIAIRTSLQVTNDGIESLYSPYSP